MFYTNTVQPALFSSNYFWYDSYTNIYTCNAALQEMPASSGMTSPVKKPFDWRSQVSAGIFLFLPW
jgi:hypothetical protein